MLDVLDKELETRGHRFVRYADDCNIYVRSRRAGERVMASVTDFLARRLQAARFGPLHLLAHALHAGGVHRVVHELALLEQVLQRFPVEGLVDGGIEPRPHLRLVAVADGVEQQLQVLRKRLEPGEALSQWCPRCLGRADRHEAAVLARRAEHSEALDEPNRVLRGSHPGQFDADPSLSQRLIRG